MSETNFTKLFSSITASTIWSEKATTKVVWITMLAMADAAGFVYASVPGLAKISGVTIEETIEAIDLLMAPDEWSRDKDNEGRRLEEIDGGWAILNHPKYRKRRNAEERLAYQREYMRNRRAKLKEAVSSGVNNVSKCKPRLAQAEADTKAEAKPKSIATLKRDDSMLEVFRYWQHVLNHPRAKLDDNRKKIITRALKNYSVEDLKKAIDGCSLTPHNMGDNDSGAIYDGIDLILRDASQIDRFMANSDNPPTGGRIKTMEQSNRAAEAQTQRILGYIDPFGDTKS